MIALDHIVVAARSLEEGVAWVESRLAGPGAGEPGEAHHEGLGPEARVRAPRGLVELRE